MAAGEDRVVEQAHALVGLGRLEDRRRRSRDDLARVVGIEQERAHGVGRVAVDAVVQLEPAVLGHERDGGGARPQLVPVAPPRERERLVRAPGHEVVAERQPDPADAAERLGHRPRERGVPAAHRAGEEDDVLVVREEDDALPLERAEVPRRSEAGGDPPPRDRHIGDVPAALDERGARILDPVLLHVGEWRDRRRVVDGEVDAVAASGHAQVADLREEVDVAVARRPQEPGAVAIADRARVAQVEARQVGWDVRDDDPRRRRARVEEGHAHELALAILRRQWMKDRMRLIEVERLRVRAGGDIGPRTLGDAQEQDDLVADHRGGGIEHRDDLELGQRRTDVLRREDRILGEPPAEVHAVPATLGSRMVRWSRTSCMSARTRFPIAGQAICFP